MTIPSIVSKRHWIFLLTHLVLLPLPCEKHALGRYHRIETHGVDSPRQLTDLKP